MNAKKTLLLSFVLLAAACPQVHAQNTQPGGNQTTSANSGDYACVERTPNSRTWQQVTVVTNFLNGQTVQMTNSYAELCTGVCYQANGQWLDSVEQINLVADGAEAAQSPTQIHWLSDANAAGGSIQMTSPGGQNFTSGVYGLSYWDSSTGASVLIAGITNSTGEVVGNNQVLYPNAFAGLLADIQDTYMLSGFEQNVVLHEQPPPPDSLNLNPQTTWFQVITEFFKAPSPVKTTDATNGIDDDRVLDFGDVCIGQGTAFLTTQQDQSRGVKVSKQWVQGENGNVFLIEEVPYLTITNMIGGLPFHASGGKSAGKIRRTASLKSLLGKPRDTGKSKSGTVMKAAKADRRNAGFVIDYTALTGSLTNYVFSNSATYYVSGTLNLYGSPIFQGGTVVKFTNTASAGLKLLDANSNYIFQTSTYRPAVFTSANDNSVGDTISGSTGSPTSGNATYLSAWNTGNWNVLLQGARFSYAGMAFWSEYDNSHIFRDCQFVNCLTNVGLNWDTDVEFANVLAANCGKVVMGFALAVDGENMTVDNCTTLAYVNLGNSWGYYSGGMTNCIFTPTDSTITNFTTNKCEIASSGTGIYQATGGGNYYLASNIYQNAGTTNIDPVLLADLQTKTTFAPVVFSNATISMPETLGPCVARDSLPPTPGYHYDPLDYAFGGCIAAANLTFAPGTAVGWFRTSSGWYHAGQGIYIEDTLAVDFEGTATAFDYWVRANTVQESSVGNWAGGYGPGGITGWATSFGAAPTAKLRFTKCSVLGWGGQEGHFRDDNGYLKLILNDCELAGSFVGGYTDSAAMTNCLCLGVGLGDVQYDSSTYFYLRNCTLYECAMTADTYMSIRDCAVDGMTGYTAGSAGTDYDYNGYLNGSVTTSPTGLHDQTIGTFKWVAGPLGNFYQTNTSALINAGDVTAAAAGLYHFTTITNTSSGVEIPEGSSQVDVGYHYVALGANGLPIDTNGDGIPDYLEDANGNGVVDSGEIGWNVTGDLGLTVVITQPVKNSQIP